MASAAADVPTETDILCEHCGYGLNGLPSDGRCPECGSPIADSTTDDGRAPSAWDQTDRPVLNRLISTTAMVIFRTGTFFRHLQTRHAGNAARSFASAHRWIASVFLGSAAAIHFNWLQQLQPTTGWMIVLTFVGFILLARGSLAAIFFVASLLTKWEATYRGYRMPIAAVQRAMNFHSAQLLPVTFVAFLTVAGYRCLLAARVLNSGEDYRYLYLLCGEVVVGAMYLFWTYWTAMRNILYANR